MKYYFNCPKCSNNEAFSMPSESSSGLGCLLFLLGGILPALLYSNATARRVQCMNCGHIFRQPPLPRSPVSVLAMWIFFIIAIFVVLSFFMVIIPDLSSIIPKWSFLVSIEDFIKEYPRIFAFCSMAMTATLLLVSLLASFYSNFKFRNEFREHYITTPPAYYSSKRDNADKSCDRIVDIDSIEKK